MIKKVIPVLTLVVAVSAAHGAGTVAFSNGTLSRLSTQFTDGTGLAEVSTTPDFLKFGLWYGVGSSEAVHINEAPWVLGVNATTGLGLIASAADATTRLNNVPLGPETSVNEKDIWVQMIAWSARYDDWSAAKVAFDAGIFGTAFYSWEPRNINGLGNPDILGVYLWQGATGTNPKVFNAAIIPIMIPEPVSFALAGLGAAVLLVARRCR